MKRSFGEKLEEAAREIEIVRKWYFQLGGDDEEPAHPLRRRELMLEAGKPALLVVSRRAPAVTEEERIERKRAAYERRKVGKRGRGGNHQAARDVVLRILFEAHNKPMSSGDVIARWPGKVALMGDQRQKAYQALHELKKLGQVRRNDEDKLYALSEAGMRAAHALEPGGSPAV